MLRFALAICLYCTLQGMPVCCAQQKVSYVDGTLEVPLRTSGTIYTDDERICLINWSKGIEPTQFSYSSVTFIESGRFHITGVYEVVSLIDKTLDFVTIVYTDDWGRSQLLELQLKSDAEAFFSRLSAVLHRPIKRGPTDTSYLPPSIGTTINSRERTVKVRDTSIQEVNHGHGSLSLGERAAVIQLRHRKLEIDYASVTSVEYGDKVSRGLLRAVLVSAVAMNEMPFFLMRKQHKHFVTLTFDDASGAAQFIQIEVPKYTARMILLELELRTQRRVTYESEQAALDIYG